ncbi:5821_t:CDS:2, partial [Dentiscutata erythropus]
MGCFSSNLSENNDSIDLQSIQTEFRFNDGRRYHNAENAVYQLPNDEYETDRLHIQHFLLRYLLQSNFSAPIEHILSEPGAKVLDVGYPLTKVIGIDISPHQPSQIKPKNFEFIKANVLERLPFDDNTFDFVFQRLMNIGYTKEKWPEVINELVRVLKPGGFLELCEPSFPFDEGPATQRIWNYAGAAEILKEQSSDLNAYQKLDQFLQNQGQLENIKKEVKKVYYGIKHNNIELSKAIIDNIVSVANSFKPVLTKKLQISNEKFDELVKISEKELTEHDAYYYW